MYILKYIYVVGDVGLILTQRARSFRTCRRTALCIPEVAMSKSTFTSCCVTVGMQTRCCLFCLFYYPPQRDSAIGNRAPRLLTIEVALAFVRAQRRQHAQTATNCISRCNRRNTTTNAVAAVVPPTPVARVHGRSVHVMIPTTS